MAVNLIGIAGTKGSGKDTIGKMIQYYTSPCSDPDGGRYRTFERFLEAGGGSDLRNFDHQYYTEWEIKKFAGKLKQVVSILTGVSEHKFEDQEFKKQTMHKDWWYRDVYNHSTRTWSRKHIDHPIHGNYDPDTGKNEHTINKPTYRQFLQEVATECMRDHVHPDIWVNGLFADYEGLYDIDTDRTIWPKWIITDVRFPNECKAIKDHGGIIIRVERPGTERGSHSSENLLDDYNFDYIIKNDSDCDELLKKVYTFVSEVMMFK